jgi:hypothetical protein
VNQLRVSLIQTTYFRARAKTRTTENKLVTLEIPYTVAAGAQQNFRDLTLIIPPTCSSSNGLCQIIEVRYTLNLNYGKSGLSINADLNIPFVIGTIPFQDSYSNNYNNNYNSPSLYTYDPSLAIGASAPPMQTNTSVSPFSSSASAPLYSFKTSVDESEPPVYDDVVRGEMYSNDNDTFKPSYPFYNH